MKILPVDTWLTVIQADLPSVMAFCPKAYSFSHRIAVSHLRAGREKKGGIYMEPKGYRETLALLHKTYPMTLTKISAAEAIGASVSFVDKLIRDGKLKKNDGKITLPSVAWYLCS